MKILALVCVYVLSKNFNYFLCTENISYHWSLSLMDMPSVVHPDILAMGGKVEFWECEGGGVCAEMYFNPKGGT